MSSPDSMPDAAPSIALSARLPAHGVAAVSDWVSRWAPLIAAGGSVLDLACGTGRHARWLAALGHPVLALDRDAQALHTLAGVAGIATLCADLESGPWPLPPQRRFAAVVVTRYLHRPLLPLLPAVLAPGGVLIYETFGAGNGALGKPSNPDFLLRPGELLDAVRGRLRVVAYEEGLLDTPQAALVQRICAVREPLQGSADAAPLPARLLPPFPPRLS